MSWRIILNGALFQIGWLTAIQFAARNDVFLATLAPLAAVAVHLLLTDDRWAALRLIAIAALIGLVGDSIFIAISRTRFDAHWPMHGIAPIWVVALWMAFATLPNLALRWFRDRPALIAVLAAILGPLTYDLGSKLGAGEMGKPYWLHIAALAILWGTATPFLMILARKWESERITPG